MSLETFIAERQPRWAALEAAISTAKRGRLRSQSARDIERFGLLLRQASSDLAIARRDHPDAPITEYLNQLCARAHPLLYRGTALALRLGGSVFRDRAAPLVSCRVAVHRRQSRPDADRIHRRMGGGVRATRPSLRAGAAVTVRRDGARPDRHRRPGCPLCGGVHHPEQHPRRPHLLRGRRVSRHPDSARVAQQRLDARHRCRGRASSAATTISSGR